MIYPVTIQEFHADGAIAFTLKGKNLRASHSINASEAEGLIEVGASYPLELEVVGSQVEYLSDPERAFTKLDDQGNADTIQLKGRVADYLAHDAVRLDGEFGMTVKLASPLSATDFRRGSWLVATGQLIASLPVDEH